jgi:ABC-type multidrug transport system fused ATPase/permease subunit
MNLSAAIFNGIDFRSPFKKLPDRFFHSPFMSVKLISDVYGTHGSADAISHEPTGWEWWRLFKLVKQPLVFWVGVLLNAICVTGPMILLAMQGTLATALLETDFSSPDEFIETVDSISSDMILATLVLTACHGVSSFVDSYRMPHILQEIGTGVMTSVMNQDIEFFDSQDSTVIVSRVREDAENAHEAFTVKLVFVTRYLFQVILGFVMVASMHWKILLAAMCLLPFYAMSGFFGKKGIEKLWSQFNDRSTEVSVKAQEIISMFRTVRSFDAEMREHRNYKVRLDRMHNATCDTALIYGIKEALSTVSMWAMVSVLLFLSGTMAAKGEIESGAIITILSMINPWGWSCAELFSSYTEFRNANVSCAKLTDIFDHPIRIPLREGQRIGRVQGRLEFKNVSFRYPTRQDNAITRLSCTIEAGETVALVGESGCGKSTMLTLIQRFYDVDEGQILLDGVDLREIEPIALRKQISIVPQSPVMFSMSVKENIRFGVPQAYRDEVIAAAEAGNAASFITDLPQQYHTNIGQDTLSGGQKQRICIARAVMMRAPVLLLDEATAALDTENEALVQDALDRYGSGRTTIVVAHRLATVAHASRILVMDKGTLVQVGTHDELMCDQEGVYARLVSHQLQG